MDIFVPDEFKPLWVFDEEHPIVKYPAEVLRQAASPVERVNKKVRELIEKMTKAMRQANGIGLAAPQLGVSQRVIVIAPEGMRVTALINPTVVWSDGEAVGQEGCLSLPGLYGDVKRQARVEVRALDPYGKPITLKLEGMPARVVQHEIDHLDGVLFIDKADPATLHWSWPAGADAE